MKKSKELQIKLDKATEKVKKVKKTIERHKKQAQKKLDIIEKNGWNKDNKYCMKNSKDYDNAYWTICEYEHKLDDIKNAEGKLKDAERIASNWKTKLNKQIKVENTYEREMPEEFRQCQIDLANEWTKWDIQARDRMMAYRKKSSYEDFNKAYRHNKYLELNKTDEEFKKLNFRSAELLIIDLFNRIKAYTGDVVSYHGVYFAGKGLDGTIVGKDGKAKVETITAGGYNIQRLHYRMLVKEIK